MPNLPRVIGHRGAAAIAPENTLASFRLAAEAGLEWVEFDVRLDGDGALVVLHDDTLERTTDGHGRVRETSSRNIRALDAGAWFAPRFAGQRVPFLGDTLDELERLGLAANIELKADPGQAADTAAALARLLRDRAPPATPPLLSSFHAECLEVLADALPDLPRGYLVPRLDGSWREEAARLACRTVHCDHRHLSRRRAGEVKDGGYGLAAYTVDEAARARELFQWGVDGVFSNDPALLAALARLD